MGQLLYGWYCNPRDPCTAYSYDRLRHGDLWHEKSTSFSDTRPLPLSE